MEEQPYTLARWLVREGQEEAFVAAWHQLAAFFLMLKDAPRWGTLLRNVEDGRELDRKSTRLNSSHANISYAVFCLKKKKQNLHVPHYPHIYLSYFDLLSYHEGS